MDTIVVSTQHSPAISHKDLTSAVIEKIVRPVIPAKYLDENTVYHINPTGRFVRGGPWQPCRYRDAAVHPP
jgi:S-adenosylmethionine synthetase